MQVTILAPCFINSFVPSVFILVISPGTAYTFFPWSSAKSTVIWLPLFFLASITSTPSERALIILFRAGNVYLLGRVPISYSEIINPLFSKIFSSQVDIYN